MLIDSAIAVFVLGLGSAAFFEVLPQLDRMQKLARQKAIAMHMANKMIDELQMMKPSSVSASTLSTLNLIDSGQTKSPYTFNHIPMDDSTNLSPAQALRNGTGTLTVTAIDSGSILCTVEIDWTSESKKSESLVTGTVIGGYR